jgi:hypothetical protein
MNLLTENQHKMRKGERLGYKSYILHLIPNTLSGFNVCPQASPACIATCLNLSSHGLVASHAHFIFYTELKATSMQEAAEMAFDECWLKTSNQCQAFAEKVKDAEGKG